MRKKEYRKPKDTITIRTPEVLLSLQHLLAIRTVPSLQHFILRTLQSLAQLLRLLPFSTHSLHPYSGLNCGNCRLQLLSWTPGLSTITRLDAHFGNHAKVGIIAVKVLSKLARELIYETSDKKDSRTMRPELVPQAPSDPYSRQGRGGTSLLASGVHEAR